MIAYRTGSAARLELRDQMRHWRIVVGEAALIAVFVALAVFLIAALVRLWVSW